MGPFLIAVGRSLASLVRVLVMPLLRAISGIIMTLAVPVLRASAGICLVIAAIAFASDLGSLTTAAPGSMKTTSVIEHWRATAPTSIDATRAFLTKRTRPWVWDAFSAPLKLPTFVFFGLLGLSLGFLGRRRYRVNIFAN